MMNNWKTILMPTWIQELYSWLPTEKSSTTGQFRKLKKKNGLEKV